MISRYCLTKIFQFGSIETLQRVYIVIKSNRGQLSIFMGISLILVMGMLAFVINIGLFVKAKINLQNAVDAAAFAGAATQSRQLTNIANVNWEMRNTYKEWMFKYYILGQMGLVKGNNNLSDAALTAPNVSFLLRTSEVAGIASSVGFDKYNIPSICVHNNSSTDICPLYALPGIPRFPAIGVAGISEIHEAFVNKLVEEKGENCSARTQINFLAALSWAYSSGIKEIPGAPLIATNRAGAWPEALELGMRMRNLEMIVNRPPVADMDFMNIRSLGNTGSDIGLNERPIKAFWSAFRNIGGGKYKDRLSEGSAGGGGYDELASTFKLTEIAPQLKKFEERSVSGFLIPSSFNYAEGLTALDKHYLDLQAVPLNLATIFTTFATSRNQFEPNIASEASCMVSKSALPVPGYLMGFVKNPAILTYYAVKGEAEFTGLFFPRTDESQAGSFKLTAYAAAKPYGGRIGPRLFDFYDGDQSVIARSDDNGRSKAYISGIRVELSTSFKPGMPIPSSERFWANTLTTIIGGIPYTGAAVSYGIPNMIYDFNNDSQLADQNSGGSQGFETIRAQLSVNSSTSEKRGLYNSFQLKSLKQSLAGNFTGQNMTSNDLMRALVTARRVTKYDAINYLIPDFQGNASAPSGLASNAAPTVKMLEVPVQGGKGVYYKLFAPLVGENLLYKSNSAVESIVNSYIGANANAVEVYLESLLQVAKGIYELPSGVNATTNINAQAAKSIHINVGTNKSAFPPFLVSADPNDSTDPACAKDMASKFHHFFLGKSTQCGIVPLEKLMTEYIDKKNSQDGKLYYISTYLNELPRDQIMTAYYPDARQGATNDQEARAINPIGTQSGTINYSTRRNFYSTKFIPLSKLFASSPDYRNEIFMESDKKSPPGMENKDILNSIQADGTTGLNNSYYLDF